MTKIVPFIIANDVDNETLNHGRITHLVDAVNLQNEKMYHSAFLLGTNYVLPTLYYEVNNTKKIEHTNVYAYDDFRLSLFSLLVTAKIADKKYPDAPLLLLSSSISRHQQNDHDNDIKSKIPGVKKGELIVFETSDHMGIDAMFTYEGLLNAVERSYGIELSDDIEKVASGFNDRGKISIKNLEGENIEKASSIDLISSLHNELKPSKLVYASQKPDMYSPWKTY